MTAALHALAATGPLPRLAFGLAAAISVAAFAWPAVPLPPPAPAARPAPDRPGDAAIRRPLFDPGRREWTARGSRAAVLEGEPVRPVLKVRGILIDGSVARALIDDGTGDRAWLALGEGHGDWRIASIAADRVIVDQGSHRFTATFLGPPATLRPQPLVPALRR